MTGLTVTVVVFTSLIVGLYAWLAVEVVRAGRARG